jgi:hypothetical protein
MKIQNYRLQPDYVGNLSPDYYIDKTEDPNLVWQPEVYELALEIIHDAQISNLIDIGSGNGEKLRPFLQSGIHVHVFDYGENLKIVGKKYEGFSNLTLNEVNLENNLPNISNDILEDSLIVASDVIEHIVQPDNFLHWLSEVNKVAKYILVSTPDRDRIDWNESKVAPSNKAHVREWNFNEFSLLLNDYGINDALCGYTIQNNQFPDKSTLLTIFGKEIVSSSTTESNSSIVAILTIEENALNYLSYHIKFWEEQKIDLYFIVNSSIDIDLVTSKIVSENIHAIDKQDFDDKSISNLLSYDWIIRAKIENHLYTPWSYQYKSFTLNKVFSFLQSLGYHRINLKRKMMYSNKYFFAEDNSQLSITSPFKGKEKIYPLTFYYAAYDLGGYATCELITLDSYTNYCNNLVEYLSVKKLDTPVIEINNTIENTKLELENTKLELENTKLELENTRRTLKEKENSLSCKITSPLRTMKKWVNL